MTSCLRMFPYFCTNKVVNVSVVPLACWLICWFVARLALLGSKFMCLLCEYDATGDIHKGWKCFRETNCAPKEIKKPHRKFSVLRYKPFTISLKPSKWLVHIFTIFYSREQMYKAFQVARTHDNAPSSSHLPPSPLLGRGGKDSAQRGHPGKKKKLGKKEKWRKQSWMNALCLTWTATRGNTFTSPPAPSIEPTTRQL